MATSPVLLRAIKLWALKGLPGHGSQDMNDDGTNTNNDLRQLAGRSSTEAMARLALEQGKASSDEAVQQLGGEALIHNKLSEEARFFCLGAELGGVANEEVGGTNTEGRRQLRRPDPYVDGRVSRCMRSTETSSLV